MPALRLTPPRFQPSERWMVRRRFPFARSTALSPITFPTSRLRILVEIAPGATLSASPFSWVWYDITSLVREESGIQITRGRPDSASTVPAGRLSLTVDNRSGDFCVDNPYGRWYGTLDVGCPIRVSVDPGSGMSTRYTGYIYEFPPRWDLSENNRYVPLTAQGILRRLGQGTSPAQSASTTTALSESTLVGYWPCTDATGSTQAASPMSGVSALTASGAVSFASVVGPDGVSLLPDLNSTGTIYGNVPTMTAGAFGVQVAVKPTTSHSTTNYPVEIDTSSGSTFLGFVLSFDNANVVKLLWLDTSLVYTAIITTTTNPWDASWHTWHVTASQSGSDVAVAVYRDGTSIGTGTLVGQTLGSCSRLQLGSQSVFVDIKSVGYAKVYSSAAAPSASTTAAVTGSAGQMAHTRFAAVCAANTVRYSSALGESQQMGVQPEEPVLTLLRESETADAGVIVETLDFGVRLDGHTVRENAPVTLALDHNLKQLQDVQPIRDDRLVRNDVTASRTNGSTARYTDSTDVTRRGQYDDVIDVNLYTDSMLYSWAGWQVHLGTQSGHRYPLVAINLARSPELITSALAVDVSSRITIAHPPTGLPPDTIDLIVEQINEQIWPYNWAISFATSAFGLWRIAVAAADSGDTSDFLGHADWDTCALAAAIDTTQTSITVTTTPLITTVADDFPFYIRIEGEQLQVTACSGSSNPQTLTVVRSVNTVVKAHAAAATVELDPISAGYAGL